MNSNEENKTIERPEHKHGHDHDHDHWHGRHGCGRRQLWKLPFIGAAIILVRSVIVMAIWNVLIPDLFHGPTLTYVQAIGVSVLVRLLVGFGGRHFGGGPFGRFFGGGHHWGRHLSPEDREKLRETLRKRCEE